MVNEEKITWGDFIDVLTEYEILHSNFPVNDVLEMFNVSQSLRGICDAYKKKIYILEDDMGTNKVTKRMTVVHEMLHAYHYLQGQHIGERQIEKETSALCKQIFGKRGKDWM